MAVSLVCSSDECSSDDDDELSLSIILSAAALLLRKRKRSRSCWSKEWLKNRPKYGAYACLLQELVAEDPKEVKTFLRMSFGNFQELLALVRPIIEKKDTVMRKAIDPGERLAITLRYLGSGNSFTDLKYLFRVSDNTIHNIVLETCKAIYEVLKDKYLMVPSTTTDWHAIAKDFEEKWNFPNCIGAIDGKHIQIKAPNAGSQYFNYLGYHSVILLAVADANYRIIYFDVGANGRAGDAGVFRESSLAEALEKNILGIPDPKPLAHRTDPVPFFLVGDDAFSLKPYLMKPFPFRKIAVPCGGITDDAEIERRKQRIFDYRLSRARRLSENVFGILASRFGVFQRAIHLPPVNATCVTKACLALHNFLISKKDTVFAPASLTDQEDTVSHSIIPGEWRQTHQNSFQNLARQPGNRTPADARWVRNEIKEYVNLEGQVPWQDHVVFGRSVS